MKVSNFKCLLAVALVVLSFNQTSMAATLSKDAVSCGRSTASDNDALEIEIMESVTPISELVYDLSPVKNHLLEKIEKHNEGFGHGAVNSQETWNEVVSRHPDLAYTYVETGSNCSMNTRWIFNYYTCSNSSSSLGQTIKHKDVDITAKKEELKKLIESAVSVNASNSLYYLIDKDGVTSVIDTRYPIQANPSTVRRGDKTSTMSYAN